MQTLPKFIAVNRQTGERWVPESGTQQYLAVTQEGKLVVITDNLHSYVTPLDTTQWKLKCLKQEK